MRKVILFIACSLDGYIAGRNEDLSWLFTDNDYGYGQFMSGIDTVITGRKTYDLAVKLGDTFSGRNVYVFSRKSGHNSGKVNFVSSSIPEFVRRLKESEGKNIWLLGGGEIITLMQNDNLIDEYIISVHPVILGAGVPLFSRINKNYSLVLQSSVRFPSGLIQLHYMPSC